MKAALLIVILSGGGGVARGNIQGGPWGTAGSSPPPAARTSPVQLPQGWSEHVDPSSGQPYYYNAADGITTWDRPPQQQNPLDIIAAAATSNNESTESSPLEQQQARPGGVGSKDYQHQQAGGPGDSSAFPATAAVEEPIQQEPVRSNDEATATRESGTALEFGSAIPVVDSSSSSSAAGGVVASTPESDASSSSSSQQQQQQQHRPGKLQEETSSDPSPVASWDQQQQQDGRPSWNAGPASTPQQQQQPPHSGSAASSGGWGMPVATAETNQNPGWSLGDGNPDRRPYQNENVDPKQPILVDDRRRGLDGSSPGSSFPNAAAAGPRNDAADVAPKQAWFSPQQQQQQQQQMYQRQQQPPMGYAPPQQQQQPIPDAWRGGPGIQQGPPGYQQQVPPQQGASPPQQGPRPPQQQGHPQSQQQAPPQQQQQQGPPRQQQGPPQPGLPMRPQEAGRFQQRPVPRIPETQPQRPLPPPGQYGRGTPYGQAPYDGSSLYNGQQQPGQYYSPPQQQQQQQSQQYGNQLYSGGYGQYGSTSQELVPRAEPLAGVRDSLGKTWQSVLGFGNRTKEVLSTTRDTVVTNARDAGQSITAKSTGWWGQARKTLGSVFESNEKAANDYSMTGIYGSNDGLPGSRPPPPGYGGQPYGYPQQPQQQGPPRQQNYPPQYYPGRSDLPPQPPGRSQQMPPPGQPPHQGQQQPPPQHGQQQQQQYPPPGSRYPPGYNPPSPRSDTPYAHQQQQQNRSGGPQQNQWGVRGPDPKRGPPHGPQQQQQIPPMGRNNGPYGPGSPPLPGGQLPDPSKGGPEEEKEQRLRDAWQHPGLGPDGY